MKIKFKDLLLLCSDDETRDSIGFPFVVGEHIYATDGRIMARMPLGDMTAVPHTTGSQVPQSAPSVMPDRPNAQFKHLTDIILPDREFFPTVNLEDLEYMVKEVKPATVHYIKIGSVILSPIYFNKLMHYFGAAEIEVNSPGENVLWRCHELEGVLMGVKIKFQPKWAWDGINGGYIHIPAQS